MMQTIRPPRLTFYQPPTLYLDPIVTRTHDLEDQVELWWSREPCHSLLCYAASVALILGLGFGGVCLLSTTSTSLSGEWRLGVGTTLCLLALAVLLKQLLSSAIQDMNCVHSWRRIEQLKSGGRGDPALMLAVGLAVMLCGAALLGVKLISRRDSDEWVMLVFGLVLMAAGLVTVLSVSAYTLMLFLRRRKDRRRMRFTQREQAVRLLSVPGGRMNRILMRDSSRMTRI